MITLQPHRTKPVSDKDGTVSRDNNFLKAFRFISLYVFAVLLALWLARVCE